LRIGRAVRRRISRGATRIRFAGAVRRSDVFVVTYPKSGTTWVGFFLASVLADRHDPGHEPLTLVTSRRWVPDVNRDYRGEGSLDRYESLPDPRMFRLHAHYDPVLPRVIYLVRDPRAVAVSYYHHRRRMDADFELSLDAFVEASVTGPFDWVQHVGGWLQHVDRGRILVVRYEDLHEDPQTHFTMISNFCGLELTEDEIAHYVESSSFENMRRAEPPFPERRGVRDMPQVRLGEVDSWRDELSEASVRIVEGHCGALMRRLGYPNTLFRESEARPE
jgi:hypothetical protein